MLFRSTHKSLKPKYDNIKWNHNEGWFQKWCDGKTNFPIVDACMRELNTTGFLHGRGRLIVSSFLVKTMLINYKKGEKYFRQIESVTLRSMIDFDNCIIACGGGTPCYSDNMKWMNENGS